MTEKESDYANDEMIMEFIVDECITENCIENWEDFIDKIQQIDWK